MGNDLLEIANQIKELKNQQELANYLKLYELTKNPKILAAVSSSMGFPVQNSEEENKVGSMFK